MEQTKQDPRQGTTLEKAIKTLQSSEQKKSKSLFLSNEIPSKLVAKHTKRYNLAGIFGKPLVCANDNITGTVMGYGWTGMLITDTNLYFKCTKDSFFSSLVSLSNTGSIPLNNIENIKIGKHDGCYGTNYVGHQLIINNEVKGLLRMGGGLMFDEKMMDELSVLFNAMSKE